MLLLEALNATLLFLRSRRFKVASDVAVSEQVAHVFKTARWILLLLIVSRRVNSFRESASITAAGGSGCNGLWLLKKSLFLKTTKIGG